MTFDVYKVYYLTYAQVAITGDKPKELVAKNLSFAKAEELVKSLGFGHCIYPSPVEQK